MADNAIAAAKKPKTKTKPSLKGLDCAWCGGTEGECLGGPTKELQDCFKCEGSGIELDYADDDAEEESYSVCDECKGTLKTPVEVDCTGEKDCPGGCMGTGRDPNEEDMDSGGPGPMMKCVSCGDRVHQSHGSEDDDGEFHCDNHWEYAGSNPTYIGRKIAQDGGGGDGGGGDGGGAAAGGDSGGGDAYGGGAPDTGAGGDALSVGPQGSGTWKSQENPTGSFGPQQDQSGETQACPDCGDRCYSFSAANSTYWNCARCGWSSYPRKKRRRVEERVAAGYETCELCKGVGCPACKESGLDIALGDEPADTSGELHQSVVGKLHPGRFSGMSPQMAAIVGHLVGEQYTDPQITELNVTSDGFVTGSRSGEEPGKLFLGDARDLDNNWANLIGAAGLSNDESDHARKLYRDKVRSNDWRRRGKTAEIKGNETTPLEDPDSAQEWGPCEENDGKTSVVDFLGKKVCADHLEYALADAPSALAKAMKGVETTKGPDRLNFMNAVQQIRKDVDRGRKTLEEVKLKEDLSEQHGLSLAWKRVIAWKPVKREDEHAEEGAAVYRTVQADDEEGARQKAIEHATTHGFESPVIKSVENSHENFWNVFMRATPKPKVTANTQEMKVMECEKCGVQATYESVTRTGRRLLCAEHATSSRIANDTAGIVNRVFPLHKESQSIPPDLPDDEDMERALTAEHYDGEHEDTARGDCPVCEDAFGHDIRWQGLKEGSKLPEWLQEFVPEEKIEKTAAVACADCDGDGKCDMCGGPGCAQCGASGLCIRCGGDGYETGPNDEYESDRRLASASCPGCGQDHEFSKTAQAVDDPNDEEKHTHGDEGMEEFAKDLGAMPSSGGVNPPEWQELLDKHPWAKIEQCPGCGQGQVTCTHEFHEEADRPSFALPHSAKDVWDPQEAKFKGSEMGDFEDDLTGEGGFVPQKEQAPSMSMEDLPSSKEELKALEDQGLRYHQTVRDPDEDKTHEHRKVHTDYDEAITKHQEALDRGFESELQPVMQHETVHDQKTFHDVEPAGGGNLGLQTEKPRSPKKTSSICCRVAAELETQLKGDCIRCGKQVLAGDAADFGTALGKAAWSCANCAPLVGQNLEVYKSAHRDEIISYLYENAPEEWAKLAQNIGCPNCEGQGSTPDGKICAACFGTGSGGGVMLKGGAHPLDFTCENCGGSANNAHLQVPGFEGKKICGDCRSKTTGEKYQDFDPAYHSMPYKASVDVPEGADFGVLFGEDGQMYRTEDGSTFELMAASEHDESEEEEDDDIKRFKFDHGPGAGNDMVHSEIHQQEHVASEMAKDHDPQTTHGPRKAADTMTGTGCGRCGRPGHMSEACPTNKGHNMTENSDERYKEYSEFQPKEAAIDGMLMEDPYELDDDGLMLDPFEAADKKKPVDQYAKEQGEHKQERTEKAEELGDANEVTAAVNPGASSGTSIHDLVDNVGDGQHPVPVTLITDHKGEVAQGVEPASCRTCGQEMSAHAQWNPTSQAGSPPKQASFEQIGWMDVPAEDSRPRRGVFVKESHQPTYDVSLHDSQAPGVGDSCQYCGQGSNYALGAVKAFTDPSDPVMGRVVAHQEHFDQHKQAAPTPTPSVVPMGDGKGVVINVYANRDPDEAP